MTKNLITILLLCLAINCFALKSAPKSLEFEGKIKTFATSPQWLNLYRYQNQSPENNRSIVINSGFFFSEHGHTSPVEELTEAIKILTENPQKRCEFPARAMILEKEGLLNKTELQCPKYEYYRRKINLEAVWLVFASYHVNDPGSAFGHTLFKLQGRDNNNDLLEWGSNFAAQMTTQNPFLYAVYGLFGGFRGNYSLLPYFIKIQEYNDNDKRDLWEYKLNLTADELELFQAHMWEMDKARFDYYYLTENCSYHLLTFLDVLRPSLNFKEKLPYFVLPSTTIKIINNEPNFVSQRKYRPSQFKKVKHHFEGLQNSIVSSSLPKDHKKELSHFSQILEPNSDKVLPDFLTKENHYDISAQIIDFKMDLTDLKLGKKIHQDDSSSKAFKRKLQTERAGYYNFTSKEVEVLPPASPHLIHPSHFISIGRVDHEFKGSNSSARSDLNWWQLSYRFSFHEYLDPSKGAPKWSELLLGKVELAYEEERKKIEMQRFTLFKTEANEEKVFGGPAVTWGMAGGVGDQIFSQVYDLGPFVETIVGINWRTSNQLFRIVLPTELSYGGPKLRNRSHKALVKLLGQWFSNFHSHFQTKLSVGGLYNTFRNDSLSFYSQVEGQWSFKDKGAFQIKSDFLDKDIRLGLHMLFYL